MPDSLHALLAARLDALDPVARSLVADAAVSGRPSWPRRCSTSRPGPDQVHAGLAELVRRDVLQVSADALSPQLGSYSFTHGLLAQVAYETLSRRDLKERHLRVAAHLAASPRNEGDALAEVIARHHLDALEPGPTTTTQPPCARAAEWHFRAGERALAPAAKPRQPAVRRGSRADRNPSRRGHRAPWRRTLDAGGQRRTSSTPSTTPVLAAAGHAETLRHQPTVTTDWSP